MNVKFQLPTPLTSDLLPTDTSDSIMTGINNWLNMILATESNSTNIDDRGEITRLLAYLFGEARSLKSEITTKLPLHIGDPNPFAYALRHIADEGGVLTSENDTSTIGPVTNSRWHEVAYAMGLVMAEGDALDLPVWFVVTDLNEVVPWSAPSESWNTWGVVGNSHAPIQIGGNWYRSNAYGVEGNLLNASQWVPHALAGNVTAISNEAFQALT